MTPLAYHHGGGGGVVELILHAIVRGATYRILWGLPMGVVVVLGLVAALVLSRAARFRRARGFRR